MGQTSKTKMDKTKKKTVRKIQRTNWFMAPL
jgi:hypothetical protein